MPGSFTNGAVSVRNIPDLRRTREEGGKVTDQFILSRMGAEAGEHHGGILARKEAERIAGGGEFWWGIGTSLGTAGYEAGRARDGHLPVLFARMLSKPKVIDSSPERVFLWTHWESPEGRGEIPRHVVVTSRGTDAKTKHHALVCRRNAPLGLSGGGPFDPAHCRTTSGKVMGGSQVTALLTGDPLSHAAGPYTIDFDAELAAPYCPKLVAYRELDYEERNLLAGWRPGDDWAGLAALIRGR